MVARHRKSPYQLYIIVANLMVYIFNSVNGKCYVPFAYQPANALIPIFSFKRRHRRRRFFGNDNHFYKYFGFHANGI